MNLPTSDENSERELDSSSLSDPISQSMRHTRTIGREASLSLAAYMLRLNGTAFIPVVQNGYPLGVVSEMTLLDALASGVSPTAPVEDYLEDFVSLEAGISGAEAIKRFQADSGFPGAIVVDSNGQVLGMLFPNDLFPKPRTRLKPALVGGMATPFGVYLATGKLKVGATWWMLMATGAILTLSLLLVQVLASVIFRPFEHEISRHMDPGLLKEVTGVCLAALVFRLSPLAGIHAAEHMVVHAIERDEPLTPEVVARMPRVHPRCGTNLAVGATLLSLAANDYGLPPEVSQFQLLFGVAFTALFWRRIGGFVQYWITTRPPSPDQIRMGISSANALLREYAAHPFQSASLWQRLVASGIPYTVAGGFLTSGLVAFFLWVTHQTNLIIP